MNEVKGLLKRALTEGFDLSTLPNYNPKKFLDGLYDHLVGKNYIVSEEEGVLFVGYSILYDIAEVTVKDTTMKIKPLSEDGFFDILIELFKYIGIAAKIPLGTNRAPEDVSTEDYSEDSSEEWWL